MKAYTFFVNKEHVATLFSVDQLGGNDLTLIEMALCNERNASISCARHRWIADGVHFDDNHRLIDNNGDYVEGIFP